MKVRGDSSRFNLHGYYGSEKQREAGRKGFLNGAKTRELKSRKIRQDYSLNPRHCKNCKAILPFSKRFNDYCSRKCYVSTPKKKGLKIKNFVYTDEHRARFEAARLARKQKYLALEANYELNPNKCCKCGSKLVFKKRFSRTCGSQVCIRLCLSETYERRRKVGRTSKATWYESPTAGRVYLESSWELAVAKELDNHQIRWTRPRYLTWIDDRGFQHRYTPDFYLRDFSVYLDPKNQLVRNHPRTKEKLLAIKKQQRVTIILLDGNQLSWDKIHQLILNSEGAASTLDGSTTSD